MFWIMFGTKTSDQNIFVGSMNSLKVLTPPLLQARAREFCPSVRVTSVKIFPFTAMISSPATTPPEIAMHKVRR